MVIFDARRCDCDDRDIVFPPRWWLQLALSSRLPKSPKAESTIIPTYRTRVTPSQGVRILICIKTSLWIGKFTKKCSTSTLDVHFSMDLLNRPYYQRTLGRAYLLYQRMVCLPHFFNYFCIFRWTTGFFFESAVNVPF